jgi:hypothetical protein
VNRDSFFNNGLGDVWTATYNEAMRIILFGIGKEDFLPAFQMKILNELKPIDGNTTVKEIAERKQQLENYNEQYKIHQPFIDQEMEKLFIKLYEKCEEIL